ncbi:chemotaxis sensory transducer [Desulfurispirillum indicum S5]|uniref:Chemotaxis sensory transducer n=1 Tax=Desulfurispirillum indicum (strain ATCC BAA-1389 / DSM 22839 / S5) TaxID=653733 RepID=E6W1C1_DESIS|nr:methyl-accepting chemotaxis protein [Desulfurispirillum indicum]ADU65377.1 chemotaxis sensory transducer [Desulfurispirillum indicum S5]
MFRSMKLTAKMMIQFGVAIAALCILMAVVVVYQVTSRVVPLEQELTHEVVSSKAQEIGKWLDGHHNLIGSLARMPVFREGNTDEIASFLQYYGRSLSSEYEVLLYTDKDGMGYYHNGTVTDLSDRFYYTRIIRDRIEDRLLTNPFLARSTGNVIVAVAHAVTNYEGDVTGLIFASINTQTLSRIADNITIAPHNQGWLVDGTGQVFAHPNAEYRLALKVNSAGEKGFRNLEQAAAGMLRQNPGRGTYQEPDGIERTLIYSPVPSSPGWSFAVSIPSSHFMETSYAILNTIIAVVVIMLLFIAIVIYVIAHSISRPLVRAAEALQDIAQGDGDLTARLEVRGRDEIGQVAHWFNIFVAKLHDTIANVRASSEGVASASEELSSASTQMSHSMVNQSESVSQIASAIREMNETARSVTQAINEVQQYSQNSHEAAQQGGAVVSESRREMESIAGEVEQATEMAQSLEEKSRRVEEIIQAINDIADQTNLLALNAAIEAARAGDAGRGFAVVADEVRKLAERSTDSTREIIQIVGSIQEGVQGVTKAMEGVNRRVQHGSELSSRTSDAFSKILQGIEGLQEYISQNVTAMEEMSRTSEHISDDIQSVSVASEQTARASDEVSRASSDLARLASDVQQTISAFRVSDDNASQSRALTPYT